MGKKQRKSKCVKVDLNFTYQNCDSDRVVREYFESTCLPFLDPCSNEVYKEMVKENADVKNIIYSTLFNDALIKALKEMIVKEAYEKTVAKEK